MRRVHTSRTIKRNPIAKDLRTPKYRSRVIDLVRKYTRKLKHKGTSDGKAEN